MPSISGLVSSFLTLQSQVSPLSSIDSGTFLRIPQIPIKSPPQFNCLPSQTCWPSSSDWRTFNSTIDGRLRVTEPLAYACYQDPSSERCKQIQKIYDDPFARGATYGSMQNLKWEQCGTQSCSLNSLSPDPDIVGNCSLGRLSAYYVNATDESHVVATVNFVREHGFRLSIKNSGHDYFGRSSAANSLALWTHNMKSLEYHDSFVLSQCPSASKLSNIGVMGAGIKANEAFSYFEKFGMHITVGAAPSVGIAGGLGLAGGHGPLAPSYGLVVDQAVEFDVVTADGQFRIINECNDPELFWALRGGGGSTFAVLVSYKLQLHPSLTINAHIIEANIPLNTTVSMDLTHSQPHQDILFALAMNQPQWSKNGIAGYNFVFPHKFVSILIQPNDDVSVLSSLTAQWKAFLVNYPGLDIVKNENHQFGTYTDFAKWTSSPELSSNGLVGVGIAESSRLIPSSHFDTSTSIRELVDAFLQGLQISFREGLGISPGSGQIYATTPANTPDDSRKTSVNPAWRNSLWHVVYPGLYLSNMTQPDQDTVADTVAAAVNPLKKLTPGGGCYLNEGDYKEEDWQRTFFGANYDKLLRIKQKYDPLGLFKCWKCVGWKSDDNPIDTCYGISDSKPVPSVPLGPL